MGLQTDNHLSRAGHAEGRGDVFVFLSQMNVCSCAMPYVSCRGRRGHGECTETRRGVIRRGVICRGVIRRGVIRRGVIRRGVILWSLRRGVIAWRPGDIPLH
jgi:hypothetical protein